MTLHTASARILGSRQGTFICNKARREGVAILGFKRNARCRRLRKFVVIAPILGAGSTQWVNTTAIKIVTHELWATRSRSHSALLLCLFEPAAGQ